MVDRIGVCPEKLWREPHGARQHEVVLEPSEGRVGVGLAAQHPEMARST